MPALEPFTAAFVRLACLLDPPVSRVEACVLRECADDIIRFAFAISASRELAKRAAGVWEEAAAAWSHLR
jgi:hypothetical protein